MLDRNRQPVRDLTAGDFTVLENGSRQPIESFAAVDLPAGGAATVQTATESPAAASLADRRILVLVLDDAMVPANPQMVATVKDIARRTIKNLGQGDLATVVFTRNQKPQLDLSWDRERLLKTVDTFQSAGHVAGSDAMAETPFLRHRSRRSRASPTGWPPSRSGARRSYGSASGCLSTCGRLGIPRALTP